VLDVTDEDRLEPLLGPALAAAAEDEQEPTISFVTPAEAGAYGPMGPGLRRDDRNRVDRNDVLRLPEPSERGQQVERSRWWIRVRGPVGSLVLHLLPLLLLIDWPMSPPAEIAPIPVQMVFEPPPKATPPPPQPQPKPTPPPPRGRLASEDLGDPEAKEVDKPKGDPPPADKPAKTETPPAETNPPEKPQQLAAIAPPPLPPAKPDTPKPDPIPKPAPKPTPAAHQVPRRVEDPGNLAPHRARFPGPAATRDEYLAYMHSLIRQHYNLLTHAALGDRRGMTVVEFVVLDDGKIALVKVRRSSGYPDIDNRVAEMISAVGHFPPLPQWFQGLAMPFEFGFPFPEALGE
jgi:TonB family protein